MDTPFCRRISGLISLSWPIICTSLISQSTALIIISHLGRLDNPEYLGAATLGNMMCNVTGFSLAFGFCSALDTLLSQANGAKLYRLMGLQSQRGMVMLTIASLPVGLIWFYLTEPTLHYGLGIEPQTAKLAGLWAKVITTGLWPSLMSAVLKKFLQACLLLL